MFDDTKGPIEHFSWAKFVVFGEEHSYRDGGEFGKGKDIRIVDGKVKRWKERKGHVANKDMFEKVLDKDIEVLVIGNGVDGALMVPEDIVEYLRESGIGDVIVERTPEACRIFNALYNEGKKVGLLAHGTC